MDPSIYLTFRDLAILFANLMLFKYLVFLLSAPLYKILEARRKIWIIKRRIKNKEKPYRPLVSVIIPAWNEERGILKTIKSVLDNKYDNIEIVVVSDGSTDNTNLIVRGFIKKIYKKNRETNYKGKTIIFIKKENGGKGTALNEGITHSTGEIILTVDADSKIAGNAVGNLIKYYEDPTIDGVVGNVKVANYQSILGLTQKLEYLFGFYFKRSHAVLGAEYIFGGACASFRKKVFNGIGLYDTKNKTEDIEMTMRFRFNGYKCTYGEDVVCYTEGASSILGLVNQRLRWKKGRIDTFLKYRNMFFSLKRNHNKALAIFILPFAVFSEIQLFFEPIFISLLLGYSFITSDYISLAFGILFLFTVFFVNAFFNGKRLDLRLIVIFPFTWILFYFLVWIEFLAIVRSLIVVVRGQDIEWQKWNRQGI